MRRMAMMIGLSAGEAETYRRLHAAVWPEILDLLGRCGIRNYTIFLREPEYLLVGTWDYHGTDFDADMARIAADETNAAWWRLTGACQRPMDSRRKGEWWVPMEEVFHLD